MTQRKSMSKKTRFEVFKRDSFTCQYCGRKAPDVVLQVDHVHPVAAGGADALLNLVTSCVDCNGGKGARQLDDKSTVERQRKQLEELQERREQIEMMVDWQKGLTNIGDHATEQLADYWSELAPGWALNDKGMKSLRKMIRDFGIELVMLAMRISADEKIKLEGDPPKATQASWEAAFGYIGAICNVRKRCEGKPHMEQLYKFRGRMRHRFYYVNDRMALQLMEDAYNAGISLSDIESLIGHHRNWTGWQSNIEQWIADAKDREPA